MYSQRSVCVCLCVCVWVQNISKSYEQIVMKFFGDWGVAQGTQWRSGLRFFFILKYFIQATIAITTQPRIGAVLAQNSGGALPPSAPSSPSPFSPFSETQKYELHIGLHLKSIISRVANSIMDQILRPVGTRHERPRAGVGFFAGSTDPSPYQLGGLGIAVSSPSGVRGGAPENMDFGAFRDRYLNLGEQVNVGRQVSPAPTQNRPVSIGNAWDLRSQSYFDSGNGI